MLKDLIFRAIVVATLAVIVAIIVFGTGSAPSLHLSGLLALEPARVDSGAASIFGLAEFFAILALFVTIFNVSDFRYRYRAAVWPLNVQTIGLGVIVSISFILILMEFWFQNHFLVPHFLNGYTNFKLALATVFAGIVFMFVAACFVWPPHFWRMNARRFFDVTNYYIHQGNADRLQAIAEELSSAMKDIFVHASKIEIEDNPSSSSLFAHDVMLILADRRFCHVVVDRVPGLALRCFHLAATYTTVPFADFAHFIGHEFIANTNSAFYQEDLFGSGYSLHAKPVSKVVFGNYKLVERCALKRWSPLEADYRQTGRFDEKTIEGFYRAATSFVAAYLEETKGRVHSYAFARLLGSFKSMTVSVTTMESMGEDWYKSPAHAGLSHSIQFIAFVVKEMDKLKIQPASLRERKNLPLDPYDGLAELFYEATLHAAFVRQPEFRCWDIQHNTIWAGELQFYQPSKALAALKFKIRRKLYDQIRRMDRDPNFVGARILGFCLNVLGLQLMNRHRNHLHREDYALQRVVLHWTKRNFRRIAEEYPNLLPVCLQGFISYDKDGRRLVQANGNKIKTPSSFVYFDLD